MNVRVGECSRNMADSDKAVRNSADLSFSAVVDSSRYEHKHACIQIPARSTCKLSLPHVTAVSMAVDHRDPFPGVQNTDSYRPYRVDQKSNHAASLVAMSSINVN